MSGSPRSGFWRCPRWLYDEFVGGKLSLTELGLLLVLCTGGHHEYGLSTSYTQLAEIVELHKLTVGKAMRHLRELELIHYDLEAGSRKPFLVTLGPRLTERPDAPPDVSDIRSPIRSSDSRSGPVSGQTLTGSGVEPDAETGRVPGPKTEEEEQTLDVLQTSRVTPSPEASKNQDHLVGEGTAAAGSKNGRIPDEFWDALQAAGVIAPSPKSHRAAYAKCARELVAAGWTADDVTRRAKAYRRHEQLGPTTLSIQSLAKWGERVEADNRAARAKAERRGRIG